MKLIIYLAGLIGITVLITWFVFGITPQNQWLRVKGYALNTSSNISEQLGNTANSAGKLKSRLGERFDEASDVYHGKEPSDPYQYNPQ